MKSRIIDSTGTSQIRIAVLDSGEDAFATLQGFARDAGLSAASITAIGAFEQATVGWFDFSAKRYKKIEIDEQCEVLSAVGDMAVGDDGAAGLHVLFVLALSDGPPRGGHLLRGIVRPPLEVVITEPPAILRRRYRSDLGIALIDVRR